MDEIRFTDILVTATSVANFLRASVVDASHMTTALDLLEGKISAAEVGTPTPFHRSRPSAGPGVLPEIAAVVQAWWDSLGRDPWATMSEAQMQSFRQDVEAAVRKTG